MTVGPYREGYDDTVDRLRTENEELYREKWRLMIEKEGLKKATRTLDNALLILFAVMIITVPVAILLTVNHILTR